MIHRGTARHKLTADARGSGPEPPTVSVSNGAAHNARIGPWCQQHTTYHNGTRTQCTPTKVTYKDYATVCMQGVIMSHDMKLRDLENGVVSGIQQRVS
jgi:hypothetical protein